MAYLKDNYCIAIVSSGHGFAKGDTHSIRFVDSSSMLRAVFQLSIT
jgi:hypothetical protein